MILPADFRFSQGSLQDYVDCPRRFQLRYVRRLRWPAIETEPALEHEYHLRRGAAFHRLIRQHLTGIPVEVLSRTVVDPDLRRWWRNYLDGGLEDLPPRRYPEVELSTSLDDYQLVARYDLIAMGSDRDVWVVDWKTNRRRPRRAWMSERLQTHVYPFVLVRAGNALDGDRGIQPDNVTMIYWFADFPLRPERFTYDARQYRLDEQYLLGLIEEARERVRVCAEGQLLLPTEDRRHCGNCRYRSLCQRGIEPGWLDEIERCMTLDEPFDFSFDFEQIAELDVG